MKLFPKSPELWRAAILRLLVWCSLLIVLPGSLIAFTLWMPGESWSGAAPPLTEAESERLPRLKADIEHLAVQIGPRNVHDIERLYQAERFILSKLRGLKLSPKTQEVLVTAQKQPTRNIEVEFRGKAAPDEIVIIGAHYDTVRESPGADDNASGVTALLELAKTLANPQTSATLERTVRLVWFVNEEEPFFNKEGMGSMAYAARSRDRGEDLKVVISLDMLGYYDERQGTQHFPPIYRWKWDTSGSFIGFMGHIDSRAHVQRVVGLFREQAKLPTMGAAVPLGFAGVERSDHWPFELQGFHGLVISDTGPARNVHYHQPSDLPDTINYHQLSRVVTGLHDVMFGLASLSTPIP